MLESLVWGGLYRGVATLAHAAPTMLCGLFVAAVIRDLFGVALTRRLMGARGPTALLRAWLLGMLLPVCSIGSIPVARELLRAGLTGGTVLAFTVSAPLFNPISLLYGLTLSHPLVILGFALASMAVVNIAGMAWDRAWRAPETGDEQTTGRVAPPGWRRVALLGMTTVREAAGSTLVYAAVAVVGVMLLAVMLPAGSLQTTMKAFDPWAGPMMAVISLPAHITPTDAMMQVGSMFDHGNSVGAAYVLLSVGAGLNLGVLAWAWRAFGVRAAASWVAMLVSIVVSIGWFIERPLSFRDTPPEQHTHAFDGFCLPFPADVPDPAGRVRALLADRIAFHEWSALALLGVLVAVGVLLAVCDPRERIEAWLCAGDHPRTVVGQRRRFDVVVPAPVLGVILVGGLVAMSVLAAYVYYPDRETAVKELQFVAAETHSAVVDRDRRRAEVWITSWEDLVRRAEVGVWIRDGRVDRQLVLSSGHLRDRIEALEHAVMDAESPDETHVATALQELSAAALLHRAAVRGPAGGP
jgi:uncharacterized membrane protein YraQ (UPF0718 family)